MGRKIRPIDDRVVVRRVEADEKTRGGIVLPDSAKEKPKEGKVLAVGPGRILDDGKRAPMGVKAGDRVMFGSYAGTEIDLDGEDYVIMREEDIFAIVK